MGHHTRERAKLEADAVKKHGSLTAQFRALCTQCDEAFELVVATLRGER